MSLGKMIAKGVAKGAKAAPKVADEVKVSKDAWSEFVTEGAARKPEYKGREKIVKMKIDDFLRLAKKDMPDPEKTKTVEGVRATKGKFNSLPQLFLDEDGEVAKVVGHEGRHRARQLKKEGFETIPVRVKGNTRWSEQSNPDSFDYREQWLKKIIGEDGDYELPMFGREKSMSDYDEFTFGDAPKFNKGGVVDQTQQMLQSGFAAGGMKQDPVSGNEVPVGALPHEVRDDVDAKLSEGEFVIPADVVRFIGLQKLMQLRDKAKEGLARMESMGQMGNSDEAKANGEDPLGKFDEDEEDDDGFEAEIDDIMGGGEVEMAVGGVVPFNEEEPDRYYNTSVPPPNVGTRPGPTTPPPTTPPSTSPPATTTPPAPSPTAIPRGGNPAVDYRPVNAQTEELFINNRPTGKYRSPQKAAVSSAGGSGGGTPPPPPAGGTGGSGIRDEDGRTPQVGAPTPSVDPGQYAPPGSLFNKYGQNIDFGDFNMTDALNSRSDEQKSEIINGLDLPADFDFGSGSIADKLSGGLSKFIESKGIKAAVSLLGFTGPAAIALSWGLKKLLNKAGIDPAAAIKDALGELTGENAARRARDFYGEAVQNQLDAGHALEDDASKWWDEYNPDNLDYWDDHYGGGDENDDWSFDSDEWGGGTDGGGGGAIGDVEEEEKREEDTDELAVGGVVLNKKKRRKMAVGGVVDQTNRMLSRDNEINLDAYNFFSQKD